MQTPLTLLGTALHSQGLRRYHRIATPPQGRLSDRDPSLLLRLEEIKKGAQLAGLDPNGIVRVVSVEPVGSDAVTVYYKGADGKLAEQMLFRTDEARLSLADAGRAWAFDAPAEGFKLGLEAYRIRLAHLFDPMMAVHTSNVQPLPHQITAVYEAMLPRQPLRFVLADDPGAGKTIMAGLLIRELLMRADAKRVLIVAPGSLVEQWQDELWEKFGVQFTPFTAALDQAARINAFDENDLLIARLDQLARNDDLQAKLENSDWDLIVVDEAHKLSASFFGSKVNKTKRFLLGELLGGITRHFLLMTATPHNGKEEDFQIWLSLLDADRFYGKFREGAHKVDVSDMMRRMVKEELLKFDGTRLFPERRAYTANYDLSPMESALYAAVTDYVRNEFNRAAELDGKRRGTVGFALTQLQRRLASSPEAIYQSLKRRRKKLEARLKEEKLAQRGHQVAETLGAYRLDDVPEDIDEAQDELAGGEYEQWVDDLVDQATAAKTIRELEAEIQILAALEDQARRVVHSGQDRKWDELSHLLQDNAHMRTPQGTRRKLIIFTEHRDTLNYLIARIGNLLGQPETVVSIHGGVNRDDRRKIQEAFRFDPAVLILVATDAAGEGVNLQNANLMVNYDLPWNPNRLEQRFGRIHRIGQEEVCHLWNMVANQTREGDVFQRLFDKLEVERLALGGRVFDILGEAFDNISLKDLLIEAIRYGERREIQAKLNRVIAGALDTDHLQALMRRNALVEQHMRLEDLYAVKEEMDKAEARKLQPYFIRAFFAGWAPHLDLEPLAETDLVPVRDVLEAVWINEGLEQIALAHAGSQLVPEHYQEVKARRERQTDKILAAVNERLVKEINYWSDRWIKLSEDIAAGKQPKVQPEMAKRRVEELTARLEQRKKELTEQRHVVSATPVVIGGALVIPLGLLDERRGLATLSADAEARARVERIAMQAVTEAEQALGHRTIDVSADKCGWDITARPPVQDGKMPADRHIEVKGRAKGAETVTLSRNEILYGLNQAEKFILAIVLVDGDNYEGPFYIRKPFQREPDFGIASSNYNLGELLSLAETPQATC